mmetsp:Transcript_16342/g.29131  ORF Transcript_16342/g.29131 Transcript_16342/m.29131 type:complete len:308 (-) Transcript_16342:576-1499(-)
MVQLSHVEEAAGALQVLDDMLVRVLHVHPHEVCDGVHKTGAGVEGTGQLCDVHNPVVHADAVIVLAKRRRLVHHARAAVVGDVAVDADAEGAGGLHPLKVGEKGGVGAALELRAFELGDHLKSLVLLVSCACLFLLPLLGHRARNVLQAAFRENVNRAAPRVARLDVVEIRVDAESEVGGQRPGGGGPGNHRRAVLVALQREAHHHGGVVDVFVVLPRLEIGQRRGAGGGVRHDLVATVHEAFVPQRLEHPPHALHERRLHCFVVVVKVDPASQARDGLTPFGGVPHHNAAALLVVVTDAVGQHILA